MNRVRAMLACVCAILFLGVGITGTAFAEQEAPEKKAIVATVNINKANAVELAEKLINIGDKKAKAIVKYREDHGSFSSKEQLLNVKGIGDSTLKKNGALITL